MRRSKHDQTHAHSAVRAGASQLGGAQKLRMDLVAIDWFEAAFGEIGLGCRRQKIELADAARSQAVEELTDDAPPDPTLAMRAGNGNGADERGELMRLGAAAADEVVPIASDDECPPMIVDTVRRQVVGDEELFDHRDVRGGCATDDDLSVAHDGEDSNEPRRCHGAVGLACAQSAARNDSHCVVFSRNACAALS